MEPEDIDRFLELRALKAADFRNEEHLEFLLATELEKVFADLPLATCCRAPNPIIHSIELTEVDVQSVGSTAAVGTMVVTFVERFTVIGGDEEPRAARLDFEFYRIDGLLRFRCREEPL
jgi:hypothetical protein